MVTQKILDRVLKKGIGSAMESVIQEWVMVDLGVDEISNGESLKEEEQRSEHWNFKHVQYTSISFFLTFIWNYIVHYMPMLTQTWPILFATVSPVHRPMPGT